MTREEARRRAADMVAQMTVEEKISQLVYTSAAIERLGIHGYNWWNEALHGVARAGTATMFPQAIGMAASFDPALLGQVAAAIAEEGRAKYNESVLDGNYDIYQGLTYWSPNVNIFRDPRWGRGHETYGEDPFLTAEMGCAFVRNLQGDGPYLKAAACAKHFAVHSGPEGKRHEFDAKVTLKDMWETYLPAFERLVTEAGVESVMGAYNRTNGEVCCGHDYLLGEVLRGKWGFAGHVVSDCGAIADFHEHHRVTEDAPHSAAKALLAGCDLNCGGVFLSLTDAYEQDLVTEADIDRAAVRLYTTRYLLGEFEENRPFADIPFDRLDCEEFRALNLKMAEESAVLLKNADHLLPLDRQKIRSIAVIGPCADSRTVLRGNYYGTASESCTVAEGIRRVFPDARIYFSEGATRLGRWRAEDNAEYMADTATRFEDGALAAARHADVTVLCVGLDEWLEGEECGELHYDGDKQSLCLPSIQQHLMETLCDAVDNLVVVVTCGSSIDLGAKVNAKAKAILHAWYPGARGGEAIARLLAGDAVPSGRLPVTFYTGDAALPDFEDYAMAGRTYRYYEGKPLYPFGYGLSYTDFTYSDLRIDPDGDGCRVTVTVTNAGALAGREVVQVYAQMRDSRTVTPRFQLCGVGSVILAPGESAAVTVAVDDYWLKAVDADGNRVTPDGGITLYVGGHQPDGRSRELGCADCLKGEM